MILARGDHGDSQFLLIGLSTLNVQRLLKGEPIRITRETHGGAVPEHWTIAIMHGETENHIAAELKKHGMLRPGTQILKQPDNKDT